MLRRIPNDLITYNKRYVVQFDATITSGYGNFTTQNGNLFTYLSNDTIVSGRNIKHIRQETPGNLSISFLFTGTASIDNVSVREIITTDTITDTPVTILGENVLWNLATPVITPIPHAGLLNSNSNGTVYFEPVIADAGVYSSNLAVQLTDYPIASFESIRKYANGTYTELSLTTGLTIAPDGLSFTHTGLTAGDLVMFTYAYNKESIGRSMTLTHYDSRFVIADTANGKVYRWRITSTNGVATIALTEV